ncbi:uncharacterized protein [Macrobrachium rosenbergii]|uniref:uncharacterized protein isoform X2 n=1 Tax=Macrobrachium rosenbergii TaxID=79674 RepID=UPI0034D553DA
MASFDFNELPPVLGKLVSELTLVHYRGEQCLDEVFDWAWDNYQFDCKALKESVKSEDRANMLRLLGNQCYKAKNYAEALDSYNQSIMAAPHPVLSNVRIEETEGDAEFGFPHIDPARYGGVALEKCSTLGKGFANRSAVMLDIGEYEKCLEDIDLALEYGYPEELRPKLEARRLKCQEAQRREKVSDCSQKDSVHNLKRFVLREIVKNMNTNATLKPPVMKDPNPCIPAFSSAVRVSYWPSKGRGLVATRDIKAGEVLGVERSFAIDIRQDFLRTFCSTCAFLCVNPLPCPGCSKVTELYLGKSLINHSCSPVMASKSLGRVSFTYAVRPVAAGEELTISYVADFSSQPKLQRRGALVSDRSFLCSCQACEENWPTLPHLPEIRWSCVNCKKRVSNAGMHCHECLKRLGGKLDIKTDFEMRIIFEKVMSALGVLQRMQSKILQGEPISKQDFRHLCGAAEVAFEYSAMPSKALVGFMKIMDICGENGLV